MKSMKYSNQRLGVYPCFSSDFGESDKCVCVYVASNYESQNAGKIDLLFTKIFISHQSYNF